jgi:CP family cyanate transporter-like MFS transporter
MPQQENSRIPWVILGGAWFLSLAVWAQQFCVPPIEYLISAELSLTHAETSLLFTAPILMIAVNAIPAGIIGDRLGFKKAAGIGAIVAAIGAILRSTAVDVNSLLAYTFIYGAGLGWTFANIPKLVITCVPLQRVGIATGLISTGIFSGGGLALALTVPLFLPITNDFHGVFLLWSILPITGAILWWTLVKEPTHETSHPSLDNYTPLSQIVRNKNLWLLATLMLLVNFVFYNWTGWAPTLMMLKGASAETAGFAASLILWVAIPNALLMPRLAYKFGRRKPFIWIPTFAIALMAWAAINVKLFWVWFLMIGVGIADNTRFITMLALPADMMPKKDVGVAAGLVLAIGYSGGVIGPLIGGRILDLTGNLDQSLLLLVAISAATVGLALRLPETGPKSAH